MQYFRLICSHHLGIYDVIQGSLCDNITSSTKLKVHNISQRYQSRTEPQPQSTCTENLVKFRPHIVFR